MVIKRRRIIEPIIKSMNPGVFECDGNRSDFSKLKLFNPNQTGGGEVHPPPYDIKYV